jgi:RHS repeat-associated protein
MDGRIYDPKLGRFTSADPFVDGMNPTQRWNCYKYVSNNPLR